MTFSQLVVYLKLKNLVIGEYKSKSRFEFSSIRFKIGSYDEGKIIHNNSDVLVCIHRRISILGEITFSVTLDELVALVLR